MFQSLSEMSARPANLTVFRDLPSALQWLDGGDASG
jgi:hypothetical protein